MDPKLQLVRHLYGEADDPDERRRLLSDADLRAEWEAHRDVKQALERRPPQRPSADVLAAVYAHAAAASDAAAVLSETTPSTHVTDAAQAVSEAKAVVAEGRSEGPRDRAPDRAAVSSDRGQGTSDSPSTATMLWAGSIALIVGVLVGTLFLMDDDTTEGLEATQAPAASAEAPALEQIYWGDDHPSAVILANEVPEDLPLWDDGAAFQDLRYQMRVLNSRSPETTWYDATQFTARSTGSSMQTTTNRP